MQVPKVQDAFGEDGSVLMDAEGWERRTGVFLRTWNGRSKRTDGWTEA